MKAITIKLAAGLFAATFTGTVALAQQAPEVTVQASRSVQRNEVGRSSSGFPIVDVSLSYGVSYAGLDLATHVGALQLERRVHDAASKACGELDRQYPIGAPSVADCTKAAAGAAMVKVHDLTAAAQSTAK